MLPAREMRAAGRFTPRHCPRNCGANLRILARMTSYNRIAGQGLERLAALSDGVFAIAMTLLILDIKVPPFERVSSEADLLNELWILAPRFVMYFMAFMTMGILWVGQQTQLNHLVRATRDLAWLHIIFLAAVVILPFSTSLLAEHTAYRTPLIFYWANILICGIALYASCAYAQHAKLMKDEAPPDILTIIKRRIIFSQSFYAFGALLCIWDNYWSIWFIVLVQIWYAVGPRFAFLNQQK